MSRGWRWGQCSPISSRLSAGICLRHLRRKVKGVPQFLWLKKGLMKEIVGNESEEGSTKELQLG